MTKWSRFSLFALWILLIPLPLFYPFVTLEYPPYYDQFSSLSLYPNFLLVIPILVIGWVTLRRSTSSSLFQPLALTMPLVGLVVLTALSLFFSAVDSRLAAMMLFRLTLALSLYFALKADWLSQEMVLGGLILFLCVQGVVAGGQYWLQDDLGLSWLGEYDLEPEPGRWSIIFGQDEYWLRGYGLAPHPNILGGMVGSALLIVLFGQELTQNKIVRWLAQIAVFLGIIGLAVTFSRSAWAGAAVGLAFGFGVKLLLSLKKVRGTPQQDVAKLQFSKGSAPHFLKSTIQQMLPLFLAVAIFIPIALPALQARSQPQENEIVTQSVGERQLLISIAFDFIEDSFPIGIGAGNFGPAMLTHPDRDTFPNIHPVHNLPLLLTAELGLLGGLIWLWLMLFPAGYGLWAWWKGELTLWMIGLIGALLVLAAVDLLDYYSWGWPHGLTWRWMLFALFAKSIVNSKPAAD